MTVVAKRYDPPFKSPTQEPFICWTITKDDGTHDVTHGGTFPAESLEDVIDALIELRARTLFGLEPRADRSWDGLTDAEAAADDATWD